MKSVNYALLLMVVPFVIVGCGSSSTAEVKVKEDSKDDVAVYIAPPALTSEEQEEVRVIEDVISNNQIDYATDEKGVGINPNTPSKIGKLSKLSSTVLSKVIVQKVEEDGEDASDWIAYGSDTSTASIRVVHDSDKSSDVIELTSEVEKSGHILGWSYSGNKSWNYTESKTIKWSMKFSEEYVVYVRVSTPKGYRYLYYTARNKNYGQSGTYYIHNGLGFNSKDGTWRTFQRDLEADLKRFESDNTVTSIDGFFVRGSGRIDDVELVESSSCAGGTVYENAEDGLVTRWRTYDKTPTGYAISNVEDSDKSSRVIEFSSTAAENGFILDLDSHTSSKKICWSMNYSEHYVVYISVFTEMGHRYLYYTSADSDYGKAEGNYAHYIHHGLGSASDDGGWKTFNRDLEADLKEFESENSIISIEAFLIRGSGRVDDVTMHNNTSGEDDNNDNSTN